MSSNRTPAPPPAGMSGEVTRQPPEATDPVGDEAVAELLELAKEVKADARVIEHGISQPGVAPRSIMRAAMSIQRTVDRCYDRLHALRDRRDGQR